MSIKIWDAYRVTTDQIWPLVWRIRDRAQARARDLLLAHYVELVRHMSVEQADYRRQWLLEFIRGHRNEASFRLKRAHEAVRAAYKENVTSWHWDTYSLDVCFCIYPFNGAYYLRTFSQHGSIVGDVFDFMATLPGVEDFHYQNSTDRPARIAKADWRHREQTWEAIAAAYRDIGSHVSVNVIDWHSFRHVDPYPELAERWRAAPIPLPPPEAVWAEKLRKLRSVSATNWSMGRIEVSPSRDTIVRRGRRWFVTMSGVESEHPSLNRAGEHLLFYHLPDSVQESVRRMMARPQAP